jgi:hypothetical protein
MQIEGCTIFSCGLKAAPYSVADWRLHQIHKPDVTSSLKGTEVKDLLDLLVQVF